MRRIPEISLTNWAARAFHLILARCILTGLQYGYVHSRDRRPVSMDIAAMRRLLTYLVLSLIAVAGGTARAASFSEYQVKAVFLFNFSQFVTWPADAFENPRSPMVIGVLGADRFGSELDAVVTGERADGRSLVVRHYRDVSQIKDCQILFIDRSEQDKLGNILKTLGGRSILTVSDIDGAARSGVMIDLVLVGDHVHMRINVAAARASRLVLSSQLLGLAEIVNPGGR
jgi:YfiR/HmsC-like